MTKLPRLAFEAYLTERGQVVALGNESVDVSLGHRPRKSSAYRRCKS